MIKPYYSYKVTYATKQVKEYSQIINYLNQIKVSLFDCSHTKQDYYIIHAYIITNQAITLNKIQLTRIG